MHNVYPSSRLRILGAMVACLLAMQFAVAQTIWTGAASSNWFDAGNWSAGLPAPGNPAVIPGSGVVSVDAPLTADFDINNFGRLEASAKIVAQGVFSNSGTFVTSARLTIRDAFENFGDVELRPEGSLYLAPGAAGRSNGSILDAGWFGVEGDFTNEGSVDVTAEGGLAVYAAGEFTNPGELEVGGFYNNRDGGTYVAPNGGVLTVGAGGKVSNYGAASMSSAGVIDVSAGGRFEQKAVLVSDPGRLSIAGTLLTFDGAETRTNFLDVERGGSLSVERGGAFTVAFSLTNAGLVNVERPITILGTLANAAGGKVTTAGPGVLDFSAGTEFANAGVVENGGVIRTVGLLANTGTFTNTGTLQQENGGTIDNDGDFVNEALIENIDRIVNDGKFNNRGRVTNGSGGVIENNQLFTNATDATLENQFEVYNYAQFVNFGYVRNGVSIFNEATFDNYAFLDNVGDVFNRAGATFNNMESGVVDVSGPGIFTNDGQLVNDGEINVFDCGILVNNGTIDNQSWIQNAGIFFQNGVLNGKEPMGEGAVVRDGGSSTVICQPYTQKLDADGRTVVGAVRFASERYADCDGLQYLVDDDEEIAFSCDDLGEHEVTFSLIDRRGNRINCSTTLTIVDEEAPRLTNECPGDIAVEGVASAPAPAFWTPPTFEDNCTAVTVTSNFEPGDLFPEGPTVVTYTAVDDFGNEIVCEFTVVVTVQEGCAPKDSDGLIAYYNFRAGDGKTVLDRSGYGLPLPLEIKNRHEITWLPDCGLVNTGESVVKSLEGAKKIGRAAMMSRALTVEAWVRADKFQTGPERIVTYSENERLRNFTLGQEGDRFIFRLKTTRTNKNGMPNRQTKAGSVKIGELQHVVFTRDADGDERMYVDGELQYSGHVGGDFSTWGTHCKLSLFNENNGHRSFKGAIRNVAVYDRALTAAEVATALARGACCDEGDDSPLGQVCEGPRGRVTYERYEGIGGVDLPWLFKAAKFPGSPDVTRKLHALDIPRNVGDEYGTRTRGFLYPAKSGKYRFAVSGDDHTRLLLSTRAGEPAYASVIAGVSGWTTPGQLHKYHSQKSLEIYLEAGEAYYFELLHKEAKGRDHASVYWRVPGAHEFEIIGEKFIGDIEACGQAPTAPVCNPKVLFVVGNTKLNAGDKVVRKRLVELGYDVMVKDALWASAAMAADKGLVLISSTVLSKNLGDEFRDVSVPVMTYEAWLYDDLGMTGGVEHKDYGTQTTRKLVVTGEGDALAAGRGGAQTVFERRETIPYGNVMGSDARVIAHAPADPWMASIFAYDRGDRMAGGIEAPGVRIGFYLHNHSPVAWNAYGRDLFDAAVRYATGCEASLASAAASEVLTLEARQDMHAVQLAWTSNLAHETISYLVERSSDDSRYEVIDEVLVENPAEGFEAFSYTDAAPQPGENFYRVTAVKRDGSDLTSELRLVDFSHLGQVGLFPNPAFDQVSVSLEGFVGRELELIVTDALGRVVVDRPIEADRNLVELDVDELPAGTYGVTLRTGDYRVTKMLAISRD